MKVLVGWRTQGILLGFVGLFLWLIQAVCSSEHSFISSWARQHITSAFLAEPSVTSQFLSAIRASRMDLSRVLDGLHPCVMRSAELLRVLPGEH
jgi:hypothetical protein